MPAFMPATEILPLKPPGLSFAALRHPPFRWFLGTYVLAMMADNIEHVISYWMMFQQFHSPALLRCCRIGCPICFSRCRWAPWPIASIPGG
jgi:hypothetical protein